MRHASVIIFWWVRTLDGHEHGERKAGVYLPEESCVVFMSDTGVKRLDVSPDFEVDDKLIWLELHPVDMSLRRILKFGETRGITEKTKNIIESALKVTK